MTDGQVLMVMLFFLLLLLLLAGTALDGFVEGAVGTEIVGSRG